VGRIDHHSHFGTLVTDFSLIRSGALHRANGGYLVLDVRKVLQQPFAWEDLKRALRTREIRIEPPERLIGLSGTSSLEPERIPLDVKVVLLGERLLYHLLAEYDPEFLELFKVAADFEEEIDRGPASELEYARLVATLGRSQVLRPFDREAVARVVEEGARLAGDGEKLSTHVQGIADLLREASQLAGEAGREAVERTDVQAPWRGASAAPIGCASGCWRRRGAAPSSSPPPARRWASERALGGPARAVRLRPAQPNHRPVRMGKGEVVDIEREVELGGPIHSKGVLILAGFLGARYAEDRPFTLSASLVFEQSYAGWRGTAPRRPSSMRCSPALSGLPIRQSLAVTAR